MKKINEGARIHDNIIIGLETDVLRSGGSLMINVTNVCRALNIDRGDRIRVMIEKLNENQEK